MILQAVTLKMKKGRQYAAGKILIVFSFHGAVGPWHPNRVARALPQPSGFTQVWAVNLQSTAEDAGYIYNVMQWMSQKATLRHRLKILYLRKASGGPDVCIRFTFPKQLIVRRPVVIQVLDPYPVKLLVVTAGLY